MKNQTEEQWLEGITLNQTGSGLFLIRATQLPSSQPWAWQKKLAETAYIKGIWREITYTDCWKIFDEQLNGVAFKWVPNSVATFDQLVKSANDCPSGALCVSRCAKHGCICTAGECN